jgi:hypothetical protein
MILGALVVMVRSGFICQGQDKLWFRKENTVEIKFWVVNYYVSSLRFE